MEPHQLSLKPINGDTAQAVELEKDGQVVQYLCQEYELPNMLHIPGELVHHSIPFSVLGVNCLVGIQKHDDDTDSALLCVFLKFWAENMKHYAIFAEIETKLINELKEENSYSKCIVRIIKLQKQHTNLPGIQKFLCDLKCSSSDLMDSNTLKFKVVIAATVIEEGVYMMNMSSYGEFPTNVSVHGESHSVKDSITMKFSKMVLGGRSKSLLDSGVGSDLEVVVVCNEEKASFKVHKIFLARASPVFESMFYSKLQEKEEVSVITLHDVYEHEFQQMLCFMYDCSWSFESVENAMELYRLADRYLVEDLQNICMAYMKRNLDSHLLAILDFSYLYNLNYIKKAALNIISQNPDIYFKDESFLNMNQNTLITILSLCYMKVKSECDVFRAARSWAIQQCHNQGLPDDGPSLRARLGNGLQYIRFLSMSLKDVLGEVFESGILTNHEVLSLCRAIVDKSKNPPCPHLSPLHTLRNKEIHPSWFI